MTRYDTPPMPSNPRYSDGWWAQISPDGQYVAYGNGVIHILTVATSEVRDYARSNVCLPICWTDATTLRVRVDYDHGEALDVVTGAWSMPTDTVPTISPRVPTETYPRLDVGWQGSGVAVLRRGEEWLWSEIAIGSNEQTFLVGQRPGETVALCLEMPTGDPRVHYDEPTDTWTVAGRASGNHGTPGYRDGALVVWSSVPADTPRVAPKSLVTPFAYPITFPATIQADVWTFGDVVTGSIGGGAHPTRPNRQGIGLYPDDTPWLDLSQPVLGVWISPWDAAQGLRGYNEAKIRHLVAAYRVPTILDEIVALYRDQFDHGWLDFSLIEERIAVEVCRQTGCSLTIYDDHALTDSDGTGTQYRFGLTVAARRIRALAPGIGVVCAIRTYPDGQAGWSFEDAARALMAEGFPVTFTLALYTQAGHWAPTGVARRLEEMIRIGEAVGVLGYDVFGVGRGGESAEWRAWASQWLTTLLSRTAPCQVARWPTTTIPVVTPPVAPPIVTPPPTTVTPPKGKGTDKIALAGGLGAALFWIVKWFRRKR